MNAAGGMSRVVLRVAQVARVGRVRLLSGSSFVVDQRLRLRFARGGTSSGEHGTFGVTNPATGDTLAEVPDMGVADTVAAVDAANAAFPQWAATPAKQRSQLLTKWHDAVVAEKTYLAELMTAEQGKPLAEAAGEVMYGASFLSWFAEEAKRIDGELIAAGPSTQRTVVMRQPVGVCALVTPWNFPLAMITRKAGAALAAGCTVVIKPAEDTPLSAEALLALADDVGIPEGVLELVTCSRESVVDVGTKLATHPSVRKVSFTGSTAVGKQLEKLAAGTLKRTSMELGGNAPFIVFADADVDAAVKGAMASKFRNSGQTCVCTNRFFVHASLHDEFVEKMAIAVNNLVVGNGATAGVTQGPLINAAAVDKVETLIDGALKAGAVVLAGGQRSSAGSNFFEPTLLTNVTDEMDIASSEIFGPVAVVMSFTEDAEVVTRANNTSAGLAAYFYTNDVRRVWRVSEALQFGMVGVNTGIISSEVAPFGGIKESGFGREGSKHGINEYLSTKYLAMDIGT